MDHIVKEKRKTIKAALLFFLAFFFCGLISRGIYGATLSRVTVECPKQMYLSHTVEVGGKIEEKRRVAVLAEAGIRIDEILVQNGERVEKEQPLVQLDLKDLENLIDDKEMEIEKYKIQISAMEKNEALMAKEQAVNQQRASEDYERTRKKSDETLNNAREKVQKAKEEQAQLPFQKEFVLAGLEADSKYRSLSTDLEDKKKKLTELKGLEISSQEEKEANKQEIEKLKMEIEAVRAELSAYKKQLTETLKQEWETKKEQLSQAVKDSEQEEQLSLEAKEDNMLLANRAVEDANKEAAADSSLELARLEKRELEKQLMVYKEIKDKGGKILAPVTGDILEIHGVEGDRTGDGAILHMTDWEKGYLFTAQISEKQKKYIQIGDLAELKMGSETEGTQGIPIETMEESKKEEDMYDVSFSVTKEMGNLGDFGTMKVTAKGGGKYLCVPLPAIHSDGSQNYVLVASVKKTILGEELEAIRKNVMILDKNENYAAIATGSVTDTEQVIVSSTRQIREGDIVRLLEN